MGADFSLGIRRLSLLWQYHSSWGGAGRMNENSSLRYLGEAYDTVCRMVEPFWAALGSDAAIQAYTLLAAAALAVYGLTVVSRTLRGAAWAIKKSARHF